MKTFYVTFGMGTLMASYWQAIQAFDEGIVRAFMNKHYKGLWSSVSQVVPSYGKPLQDSAEVLWYEKAEHVSR